MYQFANHFKSFIIKTIIVTPSFNLITNYIKEYCQLNCSIYYFMQSLKKIRSLFVSTVLFTGMATIPASAQKLSFDDLSAFKKPSENWQIAGNVQGAIHQKLNLSTMAGKGVLANIPVHDKAGANKDIYTNGEYGDVDVSFDFMMAAGSNSGVYLQGRYEIQLLDSWGKQNPSAGDCGGIYERWDDKKPNGSKGYQGYAPRTNASKAPGLWQHMKISFQAPRFDAKGNKTENARIREIILNGTVIHENVELTGPTRGAMSEKEVAKGPIRIQGDHGPIAFRNFEIKNYDAPKPVFTDLKYSYAAQDIRNADDLVNLKVEETGKATELSTTYSPVPLGYVLKFEGKLKVAQAGKYKLNGIFNGGYGQLKLNNTIVLPWTWWNKNGEIDLPAGETPFELVYARPETGNYTSMGLYIEGPGIRPTALHNIKSLASPHPYSPILLPEVSETVVHRSFIDFGGKRISHGASIGSPQKVHYSMDLETGAVIRVWRGNFLNVTPMWNNRGNGISVPLGSIQDFTNTAPIRKTGDKVAENYRFRGYTNDAANRPVFKYEYNNQEFEDQIVPDAESKYLTRTIKTTAPASFEAFLAEGNEITGISDGLYMIDGQYYIRVNEGKSALVSKEGKMQLVAVANQQLTYSIIW